MPRRTLAALAGLACGILGAELTFGQLRPGPGSAVLYSIEVRNAQGDLLASPMLVGEEGRPVHLSYSGERSLLNLSLDLDPLPQNGGQVCLGYRLSIEPGIAHWGRLGVTYGQVRSVQMHRGLRLSLVMARAHSPEFEQLLRQRRRPAA